MAVMWMDNFSLYGSGDAGRDRMLNGLYAVVQNDAGASIVGGSINNSIVADPDPTASGLVFRLGNRAANTIPSGAFANVLRRVFPTAQTECGIGRRIWLTTLNSQPSVAANIIFSFRNASNGTLFNVEVGSIGQIICWRGTLTTNSINRSTILAQTTGPVVVANAWQHVEAKVLFSDTVGEIEIRVEGVTVLTATNIDTSPVGLPCAQVQTQNWNTTLVSTTTIVPVMYIKDDIAWNTSGTENNDFLGSVGIFTIFPDADDALNWLPVGDTVGWRILDNVPPNDASYIEADSTLPAAYVANMTNLPPDLISVRALQPTIRARKVDGGDGNIQVGLISGADTQLLADRPMSAAFTWWYDISEEDPATLASWTPAAVDAIKAQIDRTV